MARKRNAGEGSIFRRADGRWCAQLDLGWQNGRRTRKYIYGSTAAEVQQALLKARSDHSQALPLGPVVRPSNNSYAIGWRIRLNLRSGRQPIGATSKPSGTISYRNWVGFI
jgi:hypothetical protein